MTAMKPFELTIQIEDEAWESLVGEAQALVAGVVDHAAAAEKAAGEATLLLTSDAALQTWNRQFRGLDKPTNVLAFPSPGEGPYLGDIAIAAGVVAREAAEQGKSPAHHLAHLALHGFLHLLGYDHETDEEAAEMEARETALLAELGLPDPY
jgi:probable rRNA maturation factor